MKKDITTNLANRFHKVGFTLKKKSPAILLVVGTTGVVISGITACKATTKLNTIIEESKKEVKVHEDYVEKHGFTDEYSEKDYKNDLAKLYIQRGAKIVKLYAPSVVLGGLSLTAMISSNRIMSKRNVALAAAYATIDTSFKGYRDRVVEKFGDAVDKELRYNMKPVDVEEIVEDKNGNERKKKTTALVPDPNMYSDYARYWDESCPGWDESPEYRLTYLKQQQRNANEKLKRVGYLFLNEVYEALGFQKTIAGQSIGWIYDEKYPVGDNYVDFGIFNSDDEQTHRFVNGFEPYVVLDFNVDGPILEDVGFQFV